MNRALRHGAHSSALSTLLGPLLVFLAVSACGSEGDDTGLWPEYPSNPFVISLSSQLPIMAGRGGIIVHDVTGDELLDYLISSRESDSAGGRTALAAYDWSGQQLWVVDAELKLDEQAERNGLPGWFGPGFAVGDVDGDGSAEVVHLDRQNRVQVRSGASGAIEYTLGPFPLPGGASKWSQLQIVNLRGQGDVDLILQADPLPFRWLLAIRADTGATLWSNNNYRGTNHGGFRAFDLDGDGRDEVAGATLIDDNGIRSNAWDYRSITGHFDSLFAADVRPDLSGLEVVLLEESSSGDDRTALFDASSVLWYGSFGGNEPQNAAIGEFDASRAGLEIWNRSRFDAAQHPWVLDADGFVIADWELNDKKPVGWSTSGIEAISTIDWYGGTTQHLAVKERHSSGPIAIINAMTGAFLETWADETERIYVADVSGDAREEIVVVNARAHEIHVYWNAGTNPNAQKPRRWQQNVYRRQKQNYNYYSP